VANLQAANLEVSKGLKLDSRAFIAGSPTWVVGSLRVIGNVTATGVATTTLDVEGKTVLTTLEVAPARRRGDDAPWLAVDKADDKGHPVTTVIGTLQVKGHPTNPYVGATIRTVLLHASTGEICAPVWSKGCAYNWCVNSKNWKDACERAVVG